MEMDESGDLLDLSFLTGEEQRVIIQVLERDTELKEKDEQRVRKLRSSLSDPRALKRLSGDWFSDVRTTRPWGQVGGVDIVRASIRRKKKTRGEWDHNWGLDDTEVNGDYESEQPEEYETQKPVTRLSSEPPPQQPHDDIQDGYSSSKEEEESDTPDLFPVRRRIPSIGEMDMEEINLSPVALAREENHVEHDPAIMKGPGDKGRRSLNNSPSVPTLDSKSLSGSMMSLFSAGEFRSLEVQGWIQFSLQYDATKKELRVLIIQCRDLTPAHKQTSNSYVKCYLLPDKSVQGKRKTKVKKKTLDPLFNETLKTPLSPDFLYSRGRLNLAVKFNPQGADGLGLPPTGELNIWVKEAQQLVPHKAGNVSSYVKCCVLPDDSPTSIQRTRVIPRSLRPAYNHTMVYDGFRVEDLAEACVEFRVWDQGAISSQPLGGIRLSTGRGSSYNVPVSWMDSTEQEKIFWETVIKNPGEWREVTLPLRQNLTPR
ncbi:synaptotagmin-like protein 1 isoform X3 [Mixophyes fleayi]|uniref:synaptotagmin-like protein 1 isoform X3 n=1 Tax=Mixophyes fleayi TaxID=3061075 RepID=UPI003F4DA714